MLRVHLRRDMRDQLRSEKFSATQPGGVQDGLKDAVLEVHERSP
jgi:hypothetical protein